MTKQQPRKRVRIVKVLVQPVVMIDDGETLEEFEHAPIVVSAADWPAYSGERFPAELAAFEDSLNEEDQ